MGVLARLPDVGSPAGACGAARGSRARGAPLRDARGSQPYPHLAVARGRCVGSFRSARRTAPCISSTARRRRVSARCSVGVGRRSIGPPRSWRTPVSTTASSSRCGIWRDGSRSFTSEAVLELDYASVARLFDEADVILDDSAEEVAASLAALGRRRFRWGRSRVCLGGVAVGARPGAHVRQLTSIVGRGGFDDRQDVVAVVVEFAGADTGGREGGRRRPGVVDGRSRSASESCITT